MPNSPGYKRDYKKEYESYHGKPKQIKRRAKRNEARSKMEKAGRVSKGDGKDVDHLDHRNLSNKGKHLRVTTKSKNRSFPRTKTAKRK